MGWGGGSGEHRCVTVGSVPVSVPDGHEEKQDLPLEECGHCVLSASAEVKTSAGKRRGSMMREEIRVNWLFVIKIR